MRNRDFVEDDGGRADAGYIGIANDCTTRAIAIATQRSYQDVYDAQLEIARRNALWGSDRDVNRYYLNSIGWKWHPTMGIGTGCRVHLRAEELPKGRIIVRLAGHLCAVIDGVIHDTYDCSRRGTRCVYGYWSEDRTAKINPRPRLTLADRHATRRHQASVSA